MANTHDKRFYQLTLAIQKAINSIETPVKEKHVRSTIIGTFQEQSAITYWMVAIRLPLQDNRIVAWKFCHVTHKLLREGHPACLDDSQRHIGMIENLGKLWVHLREGYGKLVHLYCNLLVCKLKFHARNPRFPGNMQLTADELDAIAENDVNNYFQLCVELFDYMDEILTLQAAVFDSLGNARANSMTASGQCRLAALIPCAQDASHLYDCNVRLLFRLHAALPPDTLVGHRERFRQQFKKLSSFYKHASSLQYYRNLLTLPVLPSNPPNFLLQSDFGTYVTPVVSIPEPPPDEVDAVGSLIDTSDTMSQMTPDHLDELDSRPTPSPQPDPVIERDRLIDHLQNELKRMRSEVSQLVQERNTMLASMREHCTKLETQLQTAQAELEEERQKAEILAVETPEIKQKLTETEEKAKVTDEKFQKLKGAYTQLREEHITLIRQKAEVDKLAASLRAAAAQHESAKVALQQQLNDRLKDMEILQQSASSSEEIEAYKSEICNLRAELEQSRLKEVELQTVKAAMEALEIEHKTANTEHEEKLTIIENDLKEAQDSLERVKQENVEKETELVKVKQELVGLREKSGDEYKKVVEEKEAAVKQITELTEIHQREKEEITQTQNRVDTLQTQLETLHQVLEKTETDYSIQCAKLKDKISKNTEEFEVILRNKDVELKELSQKFDDLQVSIEKLKVEHEAEISNKHTEYADLRHKFDEIVMGRSSDEELCKTLMKERDDIANRLEKVIKEKDKTDELLSQNISDISELQKIIEDNENRKNQEISQLKEDSKVKLQEMGNEITNIQAQLNEKSMINEKLFSESELLTQKISVFETSIQNRDKQIEDLSSQLIEITSLCEKQKAEYENIQKETEYDKSVLNETIRNITKTKDAIINELKSMVAEKDEQVITLTLAERNFKENINNLNEEITEMQAELEITKDELLNLKEEYKNSITINQENIDMKNIELRNLHYEIKELTKLKEQMQSEKETLITEHKRDKQVLEEQIAELDNTIAQLKSELMALKDDKAATTSQLSDEISNLKVEIINLEAENDATIKMFTDRLQLQENCYKNEMTKKDEVISQSVINVEELKVQLEVLNKTMEKEKEEMDNILLEKAEEKQLLEARLEHTESERLNAECELQDLLQNNTVLEADVAALRRQLEEAQRELDKQSSRIVGCAGEAALEMADGALAALDRADSQDSNKLAAEHALRSLEYLVKCSQIKGNEETIARSAIFIAHNASQLSAYVTEVTNISTDSTLSDKLNSECKSMLTATKQCLESIKDGSVPRDACSKVRGRVERVARAAAETDAQNSGARSVDDELADMDRAIEQAATQIEDMLAASRAADSGVKLEVNGKILDACTALMGAVKILVQDARKLQNELGDPHTRQKMYRKNPQWSEGLISAAKAVVFAAKLLVTSADEAVGAAGRVEGVSAAAHEVAGSTAQLVAASRARAPPSTPALARLTQASRSVAAATGAVVAAVRAGSALVHDQEALDTSALTLTATRRLEMESKVRSLELEAALEAERTRLAALRKRHYHLAQQEENGNITNGKE